MKPVVTYSDFQEYMWYKESKSEIIPLLLIKPSVIINYSKSYSFAETFDYFDKRTGDRLTFFLPGYAQNPELGLSNQLLVRSFDENAIAFSINTRYGRANIYYNNKAFIDFVDVLEQRAITFRYYGNTELLLAIFNNGEHGECGDIDMGTVQRFDLTQLFLSGGNENLGYRKVEKFCEDVYHAYIDTINEDDFFDRVDLVYKSSLGTKY